MIRRPDVEIRNSPAPDFELEVDGRLVAVEVTRLVTGGRSKAVARRVQAALRQRLNPVAVERQLGLVGVDLALVDPPGGTELRKGIETLGALLLEGLRHLDPHPSVRRTLDLPGGPKWLPAPRVFQLPASESHVFFLTSADDWGGNLDQIALDFVASLIERKGVQTAAYEECWIVIVDTGGLHEAKDVHDAVVALRDQVPENWQAIYYESRTASGLLTQVYAAPLQTS